MVAETRDDVELIRSFVRQLTKTYDRRYWLKCAEDGVPPDEMWAEIARAGYMGITIPEAYGGSGLNMVGFATLLEELSNHGVPLQVMITCGMAGIAIAKHGSEEQKHKYLTPLADGSEKFCFAITEPNAGSNSFRISTLARLDGDDYVIRGQKVFISGVDESQRMLLVVRTTPADEVNDKREGMSLLILDTDSPGLTFNRMDTRIIMTERQFEVFFDDVRVPRENLIGEEGRGLRALFDGLNPERITAAATAIGLGRYALGKAVEYARNRIVFDVPIGAHQGLAHPMAWSKTKLELAALMTRHAAERFDAGDDPKKVGMYANMAKLAGAEAGIEAVDLAMQVHGGSGLMGDVDLITIWPLVRMFRTAPVSREMILNYISEHVLGLPRSY